MTVASSQSKIPKVVSDFIWPESQSTRYATIKRNFDTANNPLQRENLMDQLRTLINDPRQIKAFLQTEKGKENTRAFTLLAEMIRSNDAEIAKKSREVFVKYLEASVTKQNLMGSSIDPENPTKAENAFEAVCKLIDTGNPDTRLVQAKTIANSCGYLYREAGDDRTSTTWTRGKIKEEGKAGTDERLFNFFHNMQKTESGRLLHELALQSGLQKIHAGLYSAHINGTETGLSNQVKTSTDQQREVTSTALNPSRIWGDKSFINIIKANNAEEVNFLNTFKRSADFSFSITQLEKGYIHKKDSDRKALVLDFMAGFELLSFRKAGLIKAAKATEDPILNRAAKRIEEQQKDMLEALKQHAGREPELAQAIEDMFKAQGTSIFMYHMSGSLGAAERSVSTLVLKEAQDMAKDYGTDSILLREGRSLTDSFKDLTILRKETEEAVESSAISLANSILATVGRPTLIDDKAIGAFERWGTDISLSADVSDVTKASPLDTIRWDKISTAHSTQKLEYFGLDAACEDFKNQLNNSTEPAVVYVKDNFERIYGISIDEMLTKVKADEIIHASTTEESRLIKNTQDLGEAFAKIAKQARAKNNHKPSQFDISHAVTTASYSSKMQNIILGEHTTLVPEKLIAKIVNEDTKAHQDAGFGIESTGQLERLLLSPEVDKANVQKSERILGILELEKRILDSSESDEVKRTTLEHIHHNLLGEKGFSLTDINTYRTELTTALGNEARDYKGVIASTSTSTLTALLKQRFKLDDLSVSTGNISRSVMGYMKKESSLLISGFQGNLPEGLFSSGETSMLETISSVRDKIKTALEADTMEAEATAMNEMLDTFNKIGFPVNQLFPAGSVEDGTWRDHFIFADSLFHSPDGHGSDIIKVLIEIWNNILKSLDIRK